MKPGLFFAISICIASSVLSAAPLGNEIIISVKNTVARRQLALAVVDEASGQVVVKRDVSAGENIFGTDLRGEFIKTVSGLNTKSTYSILVRVDQNGDGILTAADVGTLKTGIRTGTIVDFNSFAPLGSVSAISAPDASRAGKQAVCLIHLASHSTVPMTAGTTPLFIEAAVIRYSHQGTPAYNPVFLPPGSYSGFLCIVDSDNSNSVTMGDQYQLINFQAVQSGVTGQFPIGSWQQVR